MIKKFDFEEVNLIPQKCIVNSRSECDTSVVFGDFTFNMPIIPANMECVIDEKLAEKLAKEGYFYIMHRFNVDINAFILNMYNQNLPVSISIGVNEDSYDFIEKFDHNSAQIHYITIDIAHGHSIKMEKMLKWLREKMPNTYIIAGNVSTPEAVYDLADWGADAIKVGIGPGSACTTWPTTGFGSRNCQASIVKECSNVFRNKNKPNKRYSYTDMSLNPIHIICDGGIRVPADIAKSMVLGAKMVMVGGMMSGFNDSPGNLININGIKKKEFWGSASQFQSNKSNRIEGTKYLIDFKDRSIIEELSYLKECLQSSISYGGGKDLPSLKNVKWL